MAITWTKVGDQSYDVAGATPFGFWDGAGDSSYPAGGYTVSATQNFGQRLLAGLNTVGVNSTAAGTWLVYNSTTNKIQVLSGASGSGTPVFLGTAATATNSVLTTNVATVTAANSFVAGQFVVLQGFSNAGFADLNGLIVQVITASATQFTFNHTHANVTTGADSGTAAPLTSVVGPLTSGTAVASTNVVIATNVGTVTIANAYRPGQFVVLQGFTTTGFLDLNGYIVQVITASATQFTFNFSHADVGTHADTGTVAPVITPGGAPIIGGATAEITNSVLTSNVASLSAVQAFTTNNVVVIQGLTNGATLNGALLSVISTGLTNALFEANYKLSNITTGADSGVAIPLIVGGSGNGPEIAPGTNLTGYSWRVVVWGLR